MSLEVDLRLALDGFELRVAFRADRPVTGVFGASGAGKTSLIESIAGLRRDAAGAIRLDGEVWLDTAAGRRLPPQERGVGWVAQDGLLFPHLDVRANLLAGARRARAAGADPERLLAEATEMLALGELLHRRAGTLSGGERRRVAVGRALCSAPRLLLLDEPLASLDLPLRRRLLPLLARLRSPTSPPALLVSHDPIEVQALCDELIVLQRGRVVARGEPHAVLADPRVFPLAREEGFENVLRGRLVAHRGATSSVRLGAGEGVELSTPPIDAAVGDEVLIGLPASEIVLATRRPEGLSARNVLPATIEALPALGEPGPVSVRLAPELPPLGVEVVETTPERMGLERGGRIYLVIKATSCRPYAAGRGTPAPPSPGTGS